MKIILENNSCTFNNECHRQFRGIAMGNIFARSYATLTMEYFEANFYSICEL